MQTLGAGQNIPGQNIPCHFLTPQTKHPTSGVAEMAWDVLSGVTKTAWDVLFGVANRCGMFCPGVKKWHGMFCPRMFCPTFANILLVNIKISCHFIGE